MSDEMRGSDAAALGGGDTRDDYTSTMDSSDGAARAWKRRREAVDASGAMDETMGGDDEDGGGDEDDDGGEERGDNVAMASGGDAGDDGGDDDGGDDDGGEARGGDAAMEVGEASGGRVATTGGGGDDGGEPAAKRQRGRRGGRKTGNQKDVARRASASRDPV